MIDNFRIDSYNIRVMINILILLSALIDLILFFVLPNTGSGSTYNEIEYFTSTGIALFIMFFILIAASIIILYFKSALLDIKLAGYDSKKELYEEIVFGTEGSVGYEYQRWQANTDAIKYNEWLEKKKLFYCHWWNIDITSGVKQRLKNAKQINLKF